jgi:hypothetical protein
MSYSNNTISTTTPTQQPLPTDTAPGASADPKPHHLSYLMMLYSSGVLLNNTFYQREAAAAKMGQYSSEQEYAVQNSWIEKMQKFTGSQWDNTPEKEQEDLEYLAAHPECSNYSQWAKPPTDPVQLQCYNAYWDLLNNYRTPSGGKININNAQDATNLMNSLKNTKQNDMSNTQNQTTLSGMQTEMQSDVQEADSTMQQIMNEVQGDSSDAKTANDTASGYVEMLRYNSALVK